MWLKKKHSWKHSSCFSRVLSKPNTGCTGHTATFWPKQLVHVRQTECLCCPRACWPETEVTSFALLVHCFGCSGENGCSTGQHRLRKRVLTFKGTTLYRLTAVMSWKNVWGKKFGIVIITVSNVSLSSWTRHSKHDVWKHFVFPLSRNEKGEKGDGRTENSVVFSSPQRRSVHLQMAASNDNNKTCRQHMQDL